MNTEELTIMPQMLVSVRFEDGRTLTYYNDGLVLSPGELVFVSGKLAGKPGVVEKVTTKFRANLANFERVIARVGCRITGTYEKVLEKMVSYDPVALSPEGFRSWILPPEDEEDEEEQILVGEGYELDLEEPENNEDVDPGVFERALDYCRTGKVAYICVRDGEGIAYIEGTEWYKVDFYLEGNKLTGMYCECPYPGLCKHLLAVALTLHALAEYGEMDLSRDFVMIDDVRFWSMVSRSTKRITL